MSSSAIGEDCIEMNASHLADFGEIRREIAHRFFLDPSYDVFDAMFEMTHATEGFVADAAKQHPKNVLWAGGSLGRREMLPNSDIDLFVVYDSEDEEVNNIHIEGVDKFEVGHIQKDRLSDLLRYSFIDANHFIDGRNISSVAADDIEQTILDVNTSDRQLANNISEYFYYRYFDFPQKTTTMGPNVKYSTGSSRDTIFFNMIARMGSGQFPAIRGAQPELAEAARYNEQRYGLRAPLGAVNLLFIAKNAAISVYDRTNDPSIRYVSSRSLEAIYDFCKEKFISLGYRDSQQFVHGYMEARKELELTVDTLFTKALNEHQAAPGLRKLLACSGIELQEACVDSVSNQSSMCPQSLIAFSGWMAMRQRLPGESMDEIAESMMSQQIDRVWGGLMAVVCAPTTKDETLSKLTDWLGENEKGAYLTKLITRNPSSSQQTYAKALDNYVRKEIIT